MSPLALAAVNCVYLPAAQLACGWLFTRMPERWFSGRCDICPRRDTRRALIRRWKHLLPDGASWFRGGFAKRSLASSDQGYLRRFAAETRRGEACHWAAVILCGVPFLWNPWWGDLVIAFYAALANIPCILIQRDNRNRLARVLSHKSAPAKSARS